MTQNMPTQKSATARFAKKKLVIDRRRRDNITTKMTNRLPIVNNKIQNKCTAYEHTIY